MAVNPDFKDLLSALSEAGADFIVIGAHAVMYFSVPRYTKDLSIWVRPTHENAKKVYGALHAFGAPLSDLVPDDLAVEGTTFQIGVAPNRADITTSIDGVEFDDAWQRRVASTYGGIPIAVLGRDDLIANKKVVGRPQDLLDVSHLEQADPDA